MKPKISVEGFDIGPNDQSIRVIFNGEELLTATDMDYESSDANQCCELLAALARVGIIELESDEAAKKEWKYYLDSPS